MAQVGGPWKPNSAAKRGSVGTSVAMAPRLYLEAMTAVLPDETRLRVSTVQPHPCAVGAAALALAHQD